MANGGILGMIANPAQADALGAVQAGRQQAATDMAGDILGRTLGGQIGALAKIDYKKGLALANSLGVPASSKGRMDNMIGVSVMIGKLLDAGMTNEAAQLATEEAQKIESLTGQEATRLRMIPEAIRTGDTETLNNFMAFAKTVDPQRYGSASQREFGDLTEGMSDEDKAKARRIKLGLEPRAVGSADQTIAGAGTADVVAETVSTIAEGKEGGKLAAQARMLPDIRAAIKRAETEALAAGETNVELIRAKAAMPGLIQVANKLKSLSDVATYTTGGKVFNTLVKELGFGATKGGTARKQMTSIVDNQVLPLLRDTFGAAFTAAEGDRLRDALLDPDSTPDAKKATLDAFIEQKMRSIETKEAEIELIDKPVAAPKFLGFE